MELQDTLVVNELQAIITVKNISLEGEVPTGISGPYWQKVSYIEKIRAIHYRLLDQYGFYNFMVTDNKDYLKQFDIFVYSLTNSLIKQIFSTYFIAPDENKRYGKRCTVQICIDKVIWKDSQFRNCHEYAILSRAVRQYEL